MYAKIVLNNHERIDVFLKSCKLQGVTINILCGGVQCYTVSIVLIDI
jgi:hypothetical protein